MKSRYKTPGHKSQTKTVHKVCKVHKVKNKTKAKIVYKVTKSMANGR